MPSSMIFASLVVLWLLILVPAVARHRQEVARPSVAALSGRVLARSPRRRSQEVDGMAERDGEDAGQVVATRVREIEVPSARAEPRPESSATGPKPRITSTTWITAPTPRSSTSPSGVPTTSLLSTTTTAGNVRRPATVLAVAGSTRRPRR